MEQDSKIPPEELPEDFSPDLTEIAGEEASASDLPLETKEDVIAEEVIKEAFEEPPAANVEELEDSPVESVEEAVEESVSEIVESINEQADSDEGSAREPVEVFRDPEEVFQEDVASLLDSVEAEEEVSSVEAAEIDYGDRVIPADPKPEDLSEDELAKVVGDAFEEEDDDVQPIDETVEQATDESEDESSAEDVADAPALKEELTLIDDEVEASSEEDPVVLEPGLEVLDEEETQSSGGEEISPVEPDLDEETVAEAPEEELPEAVTELDDDVTALVGEAFEDESENAEPSEEGEKVEETILKEVEAEQAPAPVDLPTELDVIDEPEDEAPVIPALTEVAEEVDIESESAEKRNEPIAVPELQILDDDEDEEVTSEIDDPQEGKSEESIEQVAVAENQGPAEEVESAEESPEESEPVASADDLLMKAGSILNGGGPVDVPEPVAAGLVEVEEEDEEEDGLMAMPDPQSLIGNAEGDESDSSDEDELMAMPDPQALMDNASSDEEESEPSTEPKRSGNVADSVGLPPPPPAPVSIDDDEEEAISDEVVEAQESTNSQIFVVDDEEDGEDAPSDPFASSDLDGFNSDLDNFEAEEEKENSDIFDGIDEEESGGESPTRTAAATIEEPSLSPSSKIKKWLNITSLAAGLALVGIGITANTFKNEIHEWIQGRDLDGSDLTTQVAILSKHALEQLNENGLYRMQWIESSIKEVSENEIRMFARVGAHLKRDLYLPVLDQYVYRQLSFSEDEFQSAMQYAVHHGNSDDLKVPEKPWSRLYRLSASRNQIVNLRASYRFTRESVESEWKLSDIRVRGEDEDFVWPEGEPAEWYGENAYNVGSPEFKELVLSYEKVSKEFLANVDTLREMEHGEAAELARAKAEKRNQLIGAMSRGTFYKGMVISGVDGADAREVTMIITETRNEGSLVKGVIKLTENDGITKHFTGNLRIEERGEEDIRGMLNLVTLAFEGEKSGQELPPFFNPGTVMRLRLKTDGFQVEGDSRDLSMRLVRTM